MDFSEYFNNLDRDLDVCYNTLVMLTKDMEDETLAFAIMGVQDRIEQAQKNASGLFAARMREIGESKE